MPPALAARDLTKRYGKTTALAGMELDVQPGELVGLLGPNGAGKSTLVRIACGLALPTAGSVELAGTPVTRPEARARLGYLAELFRFPGWLTAEEVLDTHQRLAGSAGGGREREQLLALVGLTAAATRRVDAMSKGMQQRLGLAQALVGDPQLLLLDEPTSALDPAGRRDVRDLLCEVRDRGIAVLLSSHLLGEVELVCDRVAIIADGRLVAQGSPAELTRPQGVVVGTGSGERRFAQTSREQIPDLVGRLVAQGERIYSVAEVRSSLEDAYLSLVAPAAASAGVAGGDAREPSPSRSGDG